MGQLARTLRSDWFYFILPATLIWLCALLVTARDFWMRCPRMLRFNGMAFLGIASMLLGIATRRIARRDLGKHFSIALRTLDDHVLVTDGIYTRVRHPSYTGDLMFQFGLPLLFGSWRGLLVMLLLIAPILMRIRLEERMLIAKFGSRYREYQQRSGALLPRPPFVKDLTKLLK